MSAARLVAIAGADAAHRRADRVSLAALFEHGLFERVIGEDHVGPVADQQVTANRLTAAGIDRIDLFQQRFRIDDDSCGDDGRHPRMQNAGRKLRQLVGLAVKDHGMAGVVAPLIADNDVMFIREQIDDFSFGLVAPLQTDNRRGRHGQKLRN